MLLSANVTFRPNRKIVIYVISTESVLLIP